MSEYDIAIESQLDWVSFWTSDYGAELHRALLKYASEERLAKGERHSSEIIEHESDELILMLSALTNAECYYWSREMLNLIINASKSLPDNWSLAKNHIASVSGFFWFAKELEPNRVAMAWNILSVSPTKETGSGGNIAAIHLPREAGVLPEFNAVALITFYRNQDAGFPKPLPTRTHLYLGESLKEWRSGAVKSAGRLNADPKEFEGGYEDVRLFATMLSFLQQRIMIPTRYGLSRPTRRRLASSERTQPAEVNVVKLRTLVSHSNNGEEEEVDWQCRWIVRGHWRDQWYPSLGKHQPIFIASYIKGPEDKPLKDPKRLFAVVR